MSLKRKEQIVKTKEIFKIYTTESITDEMEEEIETKLKSFFETLLGLEEEPERKG